MLPKHKNVWTQRDRFSVVYIMKTSITPEGKFTANVRISVIDNKIMWYDQAE